MNNCTTEQIKIFNYLRGKVSYIYNYNLEKKITRFKNAYTRILRTP